MLERASQSVQILRNEYITFPRNSINRESKQGRVESFGLPAVLYSVVSESHLQVTLALMGYN